MLERNAIIHGNVLRALGALAMRCLRNIIITYGC